MVIDHQYFGGQNHVLYTLTWLGIAALLLVFVAAFRQSYKSEPVLLVFVIGISLIFLSSHTQAPNLVNPINGSWCVALAASAVSIFINGGGRQSSGVAGHRDGIHSQRRHRHGAGAFTLSNAAALGHIMPCTDLNLLAAQSRPASEI